MSEVREWVVTAGPQIHNISASTAQEAIAVLLDVPYSSLTYGNTPAGMDYSCVLRVEAAGKNEAEESWGVWFVCTQTGQSGHTHDDDVHEDTGQISVNAELQSTWDPSQEPY